MALTVSLMGPSPWGFRIYGGRDFKKAITVSKVNGGSKAEQAALQPGDIILEINGQNTADMLNVEAQNKIKNSKTQLQLMVERDSMARTRPAPTMALCSPSPSHPPSRSSPLVLTAGSSSDTSHQVPVPEQTNGGPGSEELTSPFQSKEAFLVSRDENQNYRDYSISSPASLSPGPYSPYSPEPPASPDAKRTPSSAKSIHLRPWSPEDRSQVFARPLSQDFVSVDYRSNSVSSRTPTPPGRYSPHSPMDQDLPLSPRRSSSSSDFGMQKFDKESEVYKMIQENKESRTAPRQSNTFRMLQEVLEADEKEAALRFPGNLSPNPPKQSPPVGGVSKHHSCEKCGSGIVTQAVRIGDDRYRHHDCYTCTECGLNLRMRGHFWAGEEMFCEKHARERYQGPGTSPRTTVSPQH